MGNSQSVSLLSYGILEEFTSNKAFQEAYPSFANDPFSSILSFANIPRPSKNVKIPREVYPGKTSVELWDSILSR